MEAGEKLYGRRQEIANNFGYGLPTQEGKHKLESQFVENSWRSIKFQKTGLLGRTAYGVVELKLFQQLLEKDYRILVFFDEYRKELLYEGPRKYPVPELYLSYTLKEDGSGHFDHIKAVGAFIGNTK